MLKKETVFQDGAVFYAHRPAEQLYTPIAEYGSRVGDFETAKAQRAREWFINDWCPKNKVEATFECDSYGDIYG